MASISAISRCLVERRRPAQKSTKHERSTSATTEWSSCCEMQSLSRNTSLGPQSNALIRCQKKSRPTKTTYPGMANHQASHGNIIAGTMHTQQVKHEATAAARELKSTSMVSFCQRDVPQSWLRKVSMRLPLSGLLKAKSASFLACRCPMSRLPMLSEATEAPKRHRSQ